MIYSEHFEDGALSLDQRCSAGIEAVKV